MWSPSPRTWTWMWRAALCCMLLETCLHSARDQSLFSNCPLSVMSSHTTSGLNMCMSGSATSCEECLLIHPSCAWCAQEEFGRGRSLTSRCDFSQNLQKRGCDSRFIEFPTSSISILRNRPLSSKGSGSTQYDVVQIMPQKISLSLRPGDQTWFGLQVRQVEDYPVDLYYLMDLSLSMKDDLHTIRNLGTKLAEEMGKLTSNFRLGFGTFVDKNMSPFSYTAPKYQENPCNGYKLFPNCVPTFGFRHILSLTDKVDRFNEEVQKQMVSRNRDAPEGGFDAILQAAVCKEEIGWRKEAYHLLVFATDDVPHLALDGRLGGLVQPHDGRCHLNDKNEYSASTKMSSREGQKCIICSLPSQLGSLWTEIPIMPYPYRLQDYPSLALLGEKLAENNIFLIFAVTKRLYVIYKNFTALIPGTTVEILDQDSKNVIQLIITAYNNIRSKVELSVWDHPEDISLSFTATCQDGRPLPGLRKCADLMIGDTVSFNVSVEARGCPPRGADQSFTIKPVGFKDRLEVVVDYQCDCGCSRTAQTNSSICSSIGTYNCGTCHCEPGYLGARCECQEGEASSMYLSACREAEGKQICSGRGECSCNQCLCYESEFGKIYGSFCECDDFSCARHKGILCSAWNINEFLMIPNGTPPPHSPPLAPQRLSVNYRGVNCARRAARFCKPTANAIKICSEPLGHGECHCGECKCHAGYIGDNCNCSMETSSCISGDGRMCHGRGNCVCGRCQCTEPGAFGDTCEKCPTCPDACGTKRECIECRLFNSGRLADNQTCQRLCKDEIITVETLKTDDPGAVLCLYKTDNDCVMKFTYSEHASGTSILTALKEPECGGGTDALTVLLAVVGSILLVGVVLLAVWKLVITVHDRREFARFQSARSRARYEMASNPLYKQPVSTHFVETDFNMYGKSYNGGVH
ncbi:Integrin beta-5 [Collichthys lucidus]|uniref:Integrin beta n=1 Tax=Collichthys lucidus TaxID=240159 RepID=A0A4U5U357_COLLU|nr:Integrin beta-5 [Collichthys lucidus]